MVLVAIRALMSPLVLAHQRISHVGARGGGSRCLRAGMLSWRAFAPPFLTVDMLQVVQVLIQEESDLAEDLHKLEVTPQVAETLEGIKVRRILLRLKFACDLSRSFTGNHCQWARARSGASSH